MKWKTLQHNGVLFPAEYETHKIKISIHEEIINLSLKQEEMVYQWAKKKDTPYVQDVVFQKNFMMDFVKTLDEKFEKITYKDIDFSEAYKVVDEEKEKKAKEKEETKRKKEKAKAKEKEKMKVMTKEEKAKYLEKKREKAKKKREKAKKEKDEERKKYGIAIMDRKEVDIANYVVEPPGIFIGRGDHPLRGRWKPRITSKDVTLNLGKNAKVPDPSMAKKLTDNDTSKDTNEQKNATKEEWGGVVCKNDATWLAKWTDHLTGKIKYIWLADTAGLKQDNDEAKYEKAAQLRKEIDKILDKMIHDMKSNDEKICKISTVCYLIYRTAMRVGDEKDDAEADTVGATTLRKEHIRVTDNEIIFDFLGKDSVRWKETIPVKGYDVQFQKNIKKIIKDKKRKEEIFKGIKSSHVNAYYSSIVSGMTAKVFRTYLATKVVKDYLAKYDAIKKKTENLKLYHARMANLEAAKKCNHKRTIPKTFESSLEKKRERLKTKMEIKPAEYAEKRLAKAKAVTPKTVKQKQAKRVRIKKIREQIKSQKERHNSQVEKIRLDIKLTENTKDYNMGTSLRNYIDPRMVKAWTSHVGVEWEKLYTPALQKKFTWVKGKKLKWSEMTW